MFPPMHFERTRRGVLGRGTDYYLKPMNCPFHILVFKRSRGRCYRELPQRLFEFGTVYRYEKSGVVHGLTRAAGSPWTTRTSSLHPRGDGRRDRQPPGLRARAAARLRPHRLLPRAVHPRRQRQVRRRRDTWAEATPPLQEAATASGLELVPDPGGAAFYGPKICVQARDAIGRTWQMSTIQVDFNLPERFDVDYQAGDGTRQRPVMIHRALFGSIERFFGVLLEHYAGAFPAWLAPVQVVGIPITSEHDAYLAGVADRLRAEGIRVEVDTSDDRMQKKIRTAQKSEGAVHAARRGRGRRARGRCPSGCGTAARTTACPSTRRWRGSSSRCGSGGEGGAVPGRLAGAARGGPAGRLRPALHAAPDGLHPRRGQAARGRLPVLRDPGAVRTARAWSSPAAGWPTSCSTSTRTTRGT